MRRRMAAVAVVAGVLMAAGCGQKTQVGDEGKEAPLVSREGMCVPYNISAEGASGTAVIRFTADCSLLMSGYNIYMSREPMAARFGAGMPPAEVTAWNQPVWPGDVTPEDGIEEYEAEGLEDGVRYYVHVRTVFADGTVSSGSEEVTVVPGPRGRMELAIRYKGEQDGFCFARNGYVEADDLANDVYFYSLDGKDYLASPSQLGFLRSTRFKVLPFAGEYAEVAGEVAKLSSLPTDDRAAVKAGDWVQVMTDDKTFALVKVEGFAGSGEGRKVSLWYAYSPVAGAPVF